MTRKEFIKKNRAEIDAAIIRACGEGARLNDQERALWLDNDEGLYQWERSERRANRKGYWRNYPL